MREEVESLSAMAGRNELGNLTLAMVLRAKKDNLLDLGDTPADHHTLAMAQGLLPTYSHSAYEVVDADAVGIRQRQLGCRAAQVPRQHRRVARVDDGSLGRPRQQLVRVVGQVLVELVLAGHEHP